MGRGEGILSLDISIVIDAPQAQAGVLSGKPGMLWRVTVNVCIAQMR